MSAHHENEGKPACCGCEHGHDVSGLPQGALVAVSGATLLVIINSLRLLAGKGADEIPKRLRK
jgi:hypothetical protein